MDGRVGVSGAMYQISGGFVSPVLLRNLRVLRATPSPRQLGPVSRWAMIVLSSPATLTGSEEKKTGPSRFIADFSSGLWTQLSGAGRAGAAAPP
jgi:hypothetical protein